MATNLENVETKSEEFWLVLNGESARKKITEYFTFGVRQVWIVPPESKTLSDYFSRTEVKILTENDTLKVEEILPGFNLNLSEIFQAPKA